MRYITRALAILAILLVPSLAAVAASAAAQTPANANTVTIGVRDSLWSATLKENRRYLVYTPPSYSDTTFLPRRYPVLYLLDGDAHFHSVSGLIQILATGVNGTFVIPEMIVVAIPNTNRGRDMTPTNVKVDANGRPAPALASSGGMGNFLTFIKSELIPKIEQQYRTAPYRVFVGHSLGGITTINALYTMPETFNAYVAIDPSLWWDNRVLLKQAREKFSKPLPAGRALYVTQANTIQPGDTTMNVHYNSIVQFNGIMESFNQSGVRYAYKYYPNDSHGSVPMISEYDALRFIFEPYNLPLLRAIESPTFITEHFARASAALGYQIDPPEQTVDMVARVALGRDSTVAQKLFELNASLYPTSAVAHFALGDFWLAKKDSAKAIGHYERAAALRPGVKRIADKLKEVRAK